MPLDRAQLETRLLGWAAEYGGGRYENVGWQGRNLLQTLIEHRGFVPNPGGFARVPIRSAADEVEAAVRSMETTGWHRQGRVIRCDYFEPHAPMDIRLKTLRHVGVSLSRSGYFEHLAQAKAYLAGALADSRSQHKRVAHDDD